MSTTKPQFNCRLDPQVDTEIDDYSRQSGIAKGKLVEQLWSFYGLKDLRGLRERLCAHALTCRDPKQISELYLLMLSLQNIMKGHVNENH